MRTTRSFDAADVLFVFVGAFIALLVGLPLIAAMVTAQGFVLSIIWGWFVVPFGIVPISIPWAIGICTLVAMTRPARPHKEEKESDWRDLINGILRPWFMLLLAYIAKQFM